MWIVLITGDISGSLASIDLEKVKSSSNQKSRKKIGSIFLLFKGKQYFISEYISILNIFSSNVSVLNIYSAKFNWTVKCIAIEFDNYCSGSQNMADCKFKYSRVQILLPSVS